MRSPLRLYVPVYAVTLLASAFLLFAVQPLFGKMLLPLLGGAPAVWNTAMVFFQILLLAGYGYAHLISSRLKIGWQSLLHIGLLLSFALLSLPVGLPPGLQPPVTANPSLWQLGVMLAAVGGPFFVLAGTAPLLQHWFSRTPHPDSGSPYFLYAASNLGSMTALLLYPVAIEPLLTVHTQSTAWAAGYGALIALTGICALLVDRKAPHDHIASQTQTADKNDRPDAAKIASWLLLSFIPSSLMLGVTTFITTDLASTPLLWILPLALYVSTFIIAFARRALVKMGTLLTWQAVFMVSAISLFSNLLHPLLTLTLHLVLFFLTALICHMQLSAMKPANTKYLTAFYLIMSAGGALGGMFNALVAPLIFVLPYEYSLVLALSAFMRYHTDGLQSLRAAWKPLADTLSRKNPASIVKILLLPGITLFLYAAVLCGLGIKPDIKGAFPEGLMRLLLDFGINFSVIACLLFLFVSLIILHHRRWAFALVIAFILLTTPMNNWNFRHKPIFQERNFFGVLKVADAEDSGVRLFMHGTTLHGAQPLDDAYKMIPVTYYYKTTPAGEIFEILNKKKGPQKIAVLGLGVGSVACYARNDRFFDFYEIDPDVAAIAENPLLFTYLSNCGSRYKITLGDARLKIAGAPDDSYDMIFLDTFSSDNIPVHILTAEAFDLYLTKLNKDGLIAINISNRHLNLEPVITGIARNAGIKVLFKSKAPGRIEGTKISYTGSIFAILARDEKALTPFRDSGWHDPRDDIIRRPWHDDFSNILGVLRFKKPVAEQ